MSAAVAHHRAAQFDSASRGGAGSASSSSHAAGTAAREAPVVLVDRHNPQHRYQKGKFLGKGGFAKCYLLTEVDSNRQWAGKIVEKKTLIKYRAKEKLTTEIKIHRSLSHESIVGFHRFFEDHECVYILLEVCESQTLMELHKRRRVLTEPEVRYYLKQILDATEYMHKNAVIHRDLKLGNLFLDGNLRIKVGDFGLATRVTYDGERKKTLCGTPNYIAPEILDRKAGHSFPVDIWSIGCIVYTLLCGRPPFETSNIEATYKKIKSNDYKFPAHVRVSDEAVDVIKWMLSANPEERPTLTQIREHPFMQMFTPESLPISSLSRAPHFEGEPKRSMLPAAPFKSIAHRRPLGTVNANSPAQPSTMAKKESTVAMAIDGGEADARRRKIKAEAHAALAKVHETLARTLREQASAAPSHPPRAVPESVAAESVWISKWVDYSNKYGLGYQLSDGSVGVLFNDSTKMVLAANQNDIEFVERDANGATASRFNLSQFPKDMTKKVTLLKYFKNYMTEHLLNGGNQNDASSPTPAAGAMIHMKKWMRTKTAIVFRLSSSVIQINFFNHTKLIINAALGLVTFIDLQREINTYRMDDIARTNVAGDANFEDMLGCMRYAQEVIEGMLK